MAGCTAPIRSCLCALMTPMLATVSQGAQVSIPYQGLRLNGELRLVPDGRLTDGVVLTLHGGLAHGRMSLMAYLQQLLVEAGHNSLSINLSLGVDDRRGMLPCDQTHRHRQDDAIEELAAWSRWLKAQGARSIVLLGHSRGGAQVARYAALAMSPRANGFDFACSGDGRQHRCPILSSPLSTAARAEAHACSATGRKRPGQGFAVGGRLTELPVRHSHRRQLFIVITAIPAAMTRPHCCHGSPCPRWSSLRETTEWSRT